MSALLQHTLDLFDLPEGQPSVLPPRISQSGDQPTTRVPQQEVLAASSFVHPRANRELMLGGVRVAYEFVRGRRRTIGFAVGAEGLAVRAPRWVTLRDVEAAVKGKAEWIVRKLSEAQQRQVRLEAARIEWQDGVRFPFLGEPLVLCLDPDCALGHATAVFEPSSDGRPHTLRVALALAATPDQIRDVVQAWLMRQARRIFVERLDHFSPRLQVRWRKLALSSAATRWGSASADGTIRLHWRLMHFKMPVIDYVVAHELSHLRVMDHSPRFWKTVESVVPDYAERRRQLKDEPVPRWQ